MSEKKKRLFFVILTFFILISIPDTVYSNSAEPPAIVIIVPNAPEELDITIESNSDDDWKMHKEMEDKIIEKQFAFYSIKFKNSKVKVIVRTKEHSFELFLDQPLKTYHNYYVLDINHKKLIQGKTLSRSILLISTRVLITLLIEGVLFFFFGFRKKESWIAFLIINLITQGGLNIWLDGFHPFQSYIIIGLIFGEFMVFIAEMILFGMILREKKVFIRILYVLVANFFSLVVGGYLITFLPV